MNFIINEFSIISPTDKKAYNQKFQKKMNLIVGEKDSGKSTLARSILYTLGCEVKNFDFLTCFPNNIYILDFNIDSTNYLLIRRNLKKGRGSNFFKVIVNGTHIETFFDTKNFKEYLNEILDIKVVTMAKDKQETKLYPNHIFLPFYIDQDNSWQEYMDSTFKGVKFINNHKKVILEYFTGARPNAYYAMNLKKSKLKIRIDELEALIQSKELIVKENDKNIHIIENIDIDSFKSQYQYFLDMYKNIVDTEHDLKKVVNDMIYKKNSYSDMKKKLDTSIEEMIENELSETCPNCNQKISKSLEDNYLLYLTQENLAGEREKINMFIHDLEEEIELAMTDIENLKYNDKELSNKLNNSSDIIELANRADSYALTRVNGRLRSEIDKLRIERDTKNDALKLVEKSLRDLNEKDVSETYRQSMIKAFNELQIPFSYNNYYISNLESVKISLSGATKVQALIAQYLSIYNMTVENSNTINIPMFIDTYLKDDFNEDELSRTSKFIFKNLVNKHQSFVFIANNQENLTSIKDFNYNRYDLYGKGSILSDKYQKVNDRYSKFIVG